MNLCLNRPAIETASSRLLHESSGSASTRWVALYFDHGVLLSVGASPLSNVDEIMKALELERILIAIGQVVEVSALWRLLTETKVKSTPEKEGQGDDSKDDGIVVCSHSEGSSSDSQDRPTNHPKCESPPPSLQTPSATIGTVVSHLSTMDREGDPHQMDRTLIG